MKDDSKPLDADWVLKVGVDPAGRVIIFCFLPLSILLGFIAFSAQKAAGLFCFIWILWAWYTWTVGTKTSLIVFADHLQIRSPLRSFYASWTAIKKVEYRGAIVFTSVNESKFRTVIHSSTPMLDLVARHSNLFHQREHIKSAVEDQRSRAMELPSPPQSTWRVTWQLPSAKYLFMAASVAVVVELISIFV